MFPFDPSALPQITARRAFIGVDFQQAFTEAGGLPVANPPGYVHRATELAAAIRETNGDVIWVRSKFDKTRQLEEERIVVSDEAKPAKDPLPAEAEAAVDKEAFLSHDTAEILAGDGLDWSSEVADQVVKTDLSLAKTTYSAF
jgi:nicotinamidase-related amidase